MTINARRVDEDMHRKHNDDETMGTVRPAGRIRRCQRHVAHLICVGNEGRQGGGRQEGELGEYSEHYS